MQKLNFFKDYLLQQYGQQLQRIAIDLPLGCPNREGKFGAGCIYCAADGNRARHLQYHLNIAKQVERGLHYVKERYHATAPYIAYFQSFTNTYAPVAELRQHYDAALALADFKMMIISTRPDCLNGDVLDLLESYCAKYEVWVELGVQSANDATLKMINRGHDFAATATAVRRLAERNIAVCAHIILGLPGETETDFQATATEIAALPFRAIKLHQLQILKNTELARIFAAHGTAAVRPMNEYEYADAAVKFLQILPENWIIMRLVADADNLQLIAPKWWMKKAQVINLIADKMAHPETVLTGTVTADGSSTLYHPEYRQHFHSIAGAASEAEFKFVQPAGLGQLLTQHSQVHLLDIGFGLGYNSFAAVKCAVKQAAGKLSVTALELDQRVVRAAGTIPGRDSLEQEILQHLTENNYWQNQYASITLLLGDARTAINTINEPFDFIFLDAFSPETNPELWTSDFFRRLKLLLKPEGMLLTYSSAYPVRGALLKAGFQCSETPAFGRRRGGTAATLTKNQTLPPLPHKEMNIIMNSTAGVPYRDPGLKHNRKWIIEHHHHIVKKLRARGIPKWAARLDEK